jgi:hypothetical protein
MGDPKEPFQNLPHVQSCFSKFKSCVTKDVLLSSTLHDDDSKLNFFNLSTCLRRSEATRFCKQLSGTISPFPAQMGKIFHIPLSRWSCWN